MKKVVIWGAGPTGAARYDKVSREFEIIAFADSDAGKQGTSVCGAKVISAQETFDLCRNGDIDMIIIGAAETHYDDVYDQIRENVPEWDEIYYVNDWGSDCKAHKYRYDYLACLEIDMTRNCNLNCRGCLRFSNITKDTDAYSREGLERDLRRLSEIFSNIAVIRVIGGEPLLRKNIDEMMRLIRSYFPDSQLEIFTNGLLIPKIETNRIRTIRELDACFIITEYEPTKRMIGEIAEFCGVHGLPYKIFTTNRHEFFKFLNIEGTSDRSSVIQSCMSKKCTVIRDGIINRCGFPTYSYELNRKYNTNLPEDIGLNIHDEGVTARKIKEFLHNTEFCNYCTKPVAFTWSNGREKAVLSDWVVEAVDNG